jgi:hypothetical protein
MNTIDPAAYEGDIVSRLRHWRGLHLAHSGELFEEAADEIARLREAIRRLADSDATLSTQGGNVTVTMDATLADEERASIAIVAEWAEDHLGEDDPGVIALRSLLQRLGGTNG